MCDNLIKTYLSNLCNLFEDNVIVVQNKVYRGHIFEKSNIPLMLNYLETDYIFEVPKSYFLPLLISLTIFCHILTQLGILPRRVRANRRERYKPVNRVIS